MYAPCSICIGNCNENSAKFPLRLHRRFDFLSLVHLKFKEGLHQQTTTLLIVDH
ncbi:Protein FAM59B [Gossypium arboreum]|uniref:Protein FAM59B n=1 Tax=Gossypium arboreum TaxID=29729 RepID=A0A0B0MT88_GOSAR|nr:Protein FAM59B [Gossypium arboreum]